MKHINSKKLYCLLGIYCYSLLLIFFSSPSHAGGPVHGGKAAGMGTAFIAVADDPSAILHNPAGLTILKGTHIYGGNTFVIPSSTYISPSGNEEETEFQVFFPPHLYVASDFSTKDLVFGLGIYSPFGIGGRKWDDNGLTRYSSVESFIGTVSINPTIAWQILPNLSVAAGVDYMRALNRAEKMLDQFSLGADDAMMEIEADGGGWGYNFGALVTLSKTLRLGLAYRSRIEVDFDGDITVKDIAPALQPLFGSSKFDTDVNMSSTFPEIYSIGIAYFPTEKLVLAMDMEWVRWSSFKEMDMDLDDEVPDAGFTDSSTPLDWHDSFQFKVGTDYRVNDKLSLRAGYAFINNPVPDHTLGPDNPDSDQHNFSIGAGYLWKNKWTMDFFYMAGFFEDREVDNDILSGEYENFIHYIGSSVGYKF